MSFRRRVRSTSGTIILRLTGALPADRELAGPDLFAMKPAIFTARLAASGAPTVEEPGGGRRPLVFPAASAA